MLWGAATRRTDFASGRSSGGLGLAERVARSDRLTSALLRVASGDYLGGRGCAGVGTVNMGACTGRVSDGDSRGEKVPERPQGLRS